MSVHSVIEARCDGPRLGSNIMCGTRTNEPARFSVGNIIEARRALRVAGWVRRAHHDEMVDLCPACKDRVQTVAPFIPGRGRPKGS